MSSTATLADTSAADPAAVARAATPGADPTAAAPTAKPEGDAGLATKHAMFASGTKVTDGSFRVPKSGAANDAPKLRRRATGIVAPEQAEALQHANEGAAVAAAEVQSESEAKADTYIDVSATDTEALLNRIRRERGQDAGAETVDTAQVADAVVEESKTRMDAAPGSSANAASASAGAAFFAD